MGSSSGTDVTTYSLSGTGTLSVGGGNSWSIGADTAGTSVTAFNMSGGKLLVGNGMSGAQGTGARQAFVWTGGTLAAYAYSAANLTSSAAIAASATSNTLVNAGGTLAPGDIGTPGKTTITGNYSVTSTNAVLSVDIGGPTQAGAFQDTAAKYDTVSITGTVALDGTLAIFLTNGYAPPPTATFAILNSAGVSGSFQNIAFGGRMKTADGLGAFIVSQNGNSVILSDFTYLGNAPQISTQPKSLTVIAGKTATFWVQAEGIQPFTYQWYLGSNPISTGTLPWLAITNSGTNDSGSYSVIVSSTYGSVTSSMAALTVNPDSTGTSGMLYPLNQTPVYGTGAITDALGTTQGTLTNSPAPTLVSGPAVSGSGWNFSAGKGYVNVGANSFTNRLGDINQTTGITVGMWVKMPYGPNAGLDNNRAMDIGNGGTICDVTTSNGGGNFVFNFDYSTFNVSSGVALDGNLASRSRDRGLPKDLKQRSALC